MIPKHEITADGALHQVEVGKVVVYDHAYVEKYNQLDCQRMSHVRMTTVLPWLEHVPVNLPLLDFGCGNGAFLGETLLHYRKLAGAGVATRKLFGYDVVNYPLPAELPRMTPEGREWGMVTFFDSIEHVPDIDGLLSSFKAAYITISLPWCHARTMGAEWFAKWRHYKPGEHLWYFDAASLCNLMARHDYAPVFIGNPEDAVRKAPDHLPNILTGVFKRKGT